MKTNELHLATFFKSEDVLPHCGDLSYDKVVRTLVTGLASRYNLPGGDALADEVLAREQTSSTVIMEGLAVPHARVEGLDRPYAAIATSERGIKWSEGSPSKVHIVFLILTPREDPAVYLKVLHVLGTILSDREQFNLVAAMSNAGEIYRFFESGQAYLPRFLTAADIMKLAMINVWRRLKREGWLTSHWSQSATRQAPPRVQPKSAPKFDFSDVPLFAECEEFVNEELANEPESAAVPAAQEERARLLLQIHDELLFETRREDADALAKIVVEEMRLGEPLTVPLKIDAEVGSNWGEL